MRWLLLVLLLVSYRSWSDGIAPGSSHGADFNKTNAAHHNQQRASNPEVFIKGPLPVELIETETAVKEREQQVEAENAKSSREWWMIALTGFLCLVTALLAGYTAKLWRSTRDLVTGAEDASKRQLRAYLGVTGGTIRFLSYSDGLIHIQVEVEIRNTGQTPAHDVTKAIEAEFRNSDDNKRFSNVKPVAGKWPMPPNAVWHYRKEMDISIEDKADMNNFKKAIFVWGEAKYLDIYGVEQTLGFRYRSLGIITINGSQSGWALEPEEDGNRST